jgi:transcriptional regulator with XRE-family HTH domain
MRMRAQKTGKNLALKMAIIERDFTQREVASRAGIGEVRLSMLVGGQPPTVEEKRALAKVLRLPHRLLFPIHDEATAS